MVSRWKKVFAKEKPDEGFVFLSVGLYLCSFLLTSAHLHNGKSLNGFMAFIAAFLAMFNSWGIFPVWLANPFYWLALGVLFWAPRNSAILATLALAVCPFALMIREYDLGLGFYLWCCSFAVLAVGAGLATVRTKIAEQIQHAHNSGTDGEELLP